MSRRIDEDLEHEKWMEELEAEPGYPEYLQKADLFNARVAARMGWIDYEVHA